jgi:hypothetical protein
MFVSPQENWYLVNCFHRFYVLTLRSNTWGFLFLPREVPGNVVWHSCHTRNLESGFGKIIVWRIRIWYRISTDIIVYAKQYPDGDDRYDDLVLH